MFDIMTSAERRVHSKSICVCSELSTLISSVCWQSLTLSPRSHFHSFIHYAFGDGRIFPVPQFIKRVMLDYMCVHILAAASSLNLGSTILTMPLQLFSGKS